MDEEQRATDAVAMIAHDLRGPLHLIVSAASMLTTDIDVDRAEITGVIERSAARLELLIDDLMLAARPAHLAAPVRREPIVALDLLEDVAKAGGADSVHCDPEAVVYADRAALTRIVQNLVGNGVRHGRPPIEVVFELSESAAVLTVTDHGDPIDEPSRAVLFERFRTGTSVHANTGLGLHIVWRLVAAHGGTVELADDDSATTFRVTLPQRSPSRRATA